MEIYRCYQVLELTPGISQIELRQAYRDLVQVWHPDRFSHNPRLREKAEHKLTVINHAYNTLKPILEERDRLHNFGLGPKTASQPEGKTVHNPTPQKAPGQTDRESVQPESSDRWAQRWGKTSQRQPGRQQPSHRFSRSFSLRWYFTAIAMTLAVVVFCLAPFLIAYLMAEQPGLFLLPVVALLSLYSYRALDIKS